MKKCWSWVESVDLGRFIDCGLLNACMLAVTHPRARSVIVAAVCPQGLVMTGGVQYVLLLMRAPKTLLNERGKGDFVGL